MPKTTDEGKERVDGRACPSTLNQVWSSVSTVASIPQSSQRSRLLRVIGGDTSSLPIRLRRMEGASPLQTTQAKGLCAPFETRRSAICHLSFVTLFFGRS